MPGRLRRASAWLAPHAPFIVAVIVAGVAALLSLRLQLFLLRLPSAIGFDEGYTAALAERMLDGRNLPYVDGASHRGPLLYWLQALAELAGGRWEWRGTRVLAFGAFMTTLGALFATGVAARRPLAGATAVVFYVYVVCFALHPTDGVAITGEPVAAPLSMLGLFAATLGLVRVHTPRGRALWLLLAGLLTAAAGLVKQTMLPLIGPLSLWALAVAVAEPAFTRRARIWTALAPLAGFALAWVLVLGRYAVARELGTFVYWYWTYNHDVYLAAYRDITVRVELGRWMLDQPWAWFAALSVHALAVARIAGLLGRIRHGGFFAAYAKSGFPASVTLGSLGLLVAAMWGLRPWGHYFVAFFAWFGLLLGIRAEEVLRVPGRRRRLIALPVAATALLAYLGFCADERMRRVFGEKAIGGWQPAHPDALCSRVDELAPPGASIFVWGFDGDLYVTCKRRPASRYLYGTLVAGNVPPFWQDPRPERVARGAQEELAREIRENVPAVILDLPAHVGGVSITAIQPVHAVLQQSYCSRGSVTGNGGRTANVWTPKPRDAACPALRLPQAFTVVGQLGKAPSLAGSAVASPSGAPPASAPPAASGGPPPLPGATAPRVPLGPFRSFVPRENL